MPFLPSLDHGLVCLLSVLIPFDRTPRNLRDYTNFYTPPPMGGQTKTRTYCSVQYKKISPPHPGPGISRFPSIKLAGSCSSSKSDTTRQ